MRPLGLAERSTAGKLNAAPATAACCKKVRRVGVDEAAFMKVRRPGIQFEARHDASPESGANGAFRRPGDGSAESSLFVPEGKEIAWFSSGGECLSMVARAVSLSPTSEIKTGVCPNLGYGPAGHWTSAG